MNRGGVYHRGIRDTAPTTARFHYGWNHPETALAYERFCSTYDRYQRANLAIAVKLDAARTQELLDLGAGTGRTTEVVLRQLPNVSRAVCVEPALAMRNVGARRLADPRVTWVRALPASGAFDAIVCGAAFWALSAPTERIDELARLLCPGGQLVLSLVAAYVGEVDADEAGAFLEPLAGLPTNHREAAPEPMGEPLTLDAIEAALEHAGLSCDLFRLAHRQTGAEFRDWMKIPPLTDSLLGHLCAQERSSLLDEVFRGHETEMRNEHWIIVRAVRRR